MLALTRQRNGRCSSDRTAARRRRAASLNGSNQSIATAVKATAAAASSSTVAVAAGHIHKDDGTCHEGCCPGNEIPALSLTFRLVTHDDLAEVHRMEAASYPDDEAASLSSLTYRCNNAREFFLLAHGRPVDASHDDGKEELVGFVCGTLTSTSTLTHDTMFEHDAKGRLQI
jgi:hypothetical protein